ncbi:MAG: hypothetical protein DMF84_07960 [Acidobacteria bacterium]|nr:MAG: hypothetical protein DMF84_07960 [Acidobacteriota bacterium]
MTIEARLLIDLSGLAGLAWILALVRARRLYVGYAAIFLIIIAGAMAAASIPGASAAAARVAAPFGTGTIAAGILIALLIYLCHQITLVADRVNAVAQEIAIRSAGAPEGASPDPTPQAGH